MNIVVDGSNVSIHYILRDSDGEMIESTYDSEPYDFIQGEGEIVYGLEQALYGHSSGDTFKEEINKPYSL